MKIIGLTGSIATGKSSVSEMFHRLRIPVHDSDKIVHSLLGPKGAAIQSITELFENVGDNEKGIDRKKLGELVFSDPDAKTALEALVHPLVQTDRNTFLNRMNNQRRKMVVVDIPLLYENGYEYLCDKIICVWAPDFLQKRRAMRRADMSEKKLDAILKGQIPQKEKMNLADFCLPTGLGKAYSFRLLKRWLSHQ